jgi:hypothetical protein
MADHQGRIDIPIMHSAAVLAGPRADVQRHLIGFEPAAVARLGGGYPLVGQNEVLADLLALVFNLGSQAVPCGIADQLGKAMIFLHVRDPQRVNADRLIFVNQTCSSPKGGGSSFFAKCAIANTVPQACDNLTHRAAGQEKEKEQCESHRHSSSYWLQSHNHRRNNILNNTGV